MASAKALVGAQQAAAIPETRPWLDERRGRQAAKMGCSCPGAHEGCSWTWEKELAMLRGGNGDRDAESL